MNDVYASTVKPHRGGMILAFGLVGLLCCVVFGILAWVMGGADLKEMAAGRMDPTGEGMTRAGWILGIIGTALGILTILGVLIALAVPALIVAGQRM